MASGSQWSEGGVGRSGDRRGSVPRIDSPSDGGEVSEKGHHLDRPHLIPCRVCLSSSSVVASPSSSGGELRYVRVYVTERRRRSRRSSRGCSNATDAVESITSKPDGKYRHSSNMN